MELAESEDIENEITIEELLSRPWSPDSIPIEYPRETLTKDKEILMQAVKTHV